MPDVPESHPRKDSLSARQKIVDGTKRGLLADSAMIAHGRGEAFDYLLGEKTTESATMAIRRVATLLTSAERPVISTNGNTAVLAGESMIRVAAVVGCPGCFLYLESSGILSLKRRVLASSKAIGARRFVRYGFSGMKRTSGLRVSKDRVRYAPKMELV